MHEETLVAVFDVGAQADAAVMALVKGGVATGGIERHATAALTSPLSSSAGGNGFWSTLFGGETSQEQNEVYERTVRAGGEVMTVLMDERDADHIMTILEQFGPIDVAERAATYGLVSPMSVAAPLAAGRLPAAADASEQSLQLSEERLDVGKRAVSRGATRLRRFVRTQAVEQTVTLRDERISIMRRPAAADAATGPDAFIDQVIEMTETDEEVVITKTARVREEVVLHKEVTERIETVRENLRREEIEVDRIDASTADVLLKSGK